MKKKPKRIRPVESAPAPGKLKQPKRQTETGMMTRPEPYTSGRAPRG